jgi:protein SCO1/2
MTRICQLAIACAIVALVAGGCVPAAAAVVGTDLGGVAAPDFTLVDGLTGRAVMLSGLHGDVVVLAFLYMRCLDVCPLTAERFRTAQQSLGAEASRVTFVAVSVDPEYDTPVATQQFSAAHGLSEHWYYLVGPRPALQAVWNAYGVAAYGVGLGSGASAVNHTDAIYVIDAQGKERVLMNSTQVPDEMVRNVRAVLGSDK